MHAKDYSACLICKKCQVKLEPDEVVLEYLQHEFRVMVPRCPSCGQVYLPENLVRGRIAQVEVELEDK